jgi:hypothetical protein
MPIHGVMFGLPQTLQIKFDHPQSWLRILGGVILQILICQHCIHGAFCAAGSAHLHSQNTVQMTSGLAKGYAQINGKDGQILMVIYIYYYSSGESSTTTGNTGFGFHLLSFRYKISLTYMQELRTQSPLKMPLATNGRFF